MKVVGLLLNRVSKPVKNGTGKSEAVSLSSQVMSDPRTLMSRKRDEVGDKPLVAEEGSTSSEGSSIETGQYNSCVT